MILNSRTIVTILLHILALTFLLKCVFSLFQTIRIHAKTEKDYNKLTYLFLHYNKYFYKLKNIA